MTSKKWVASVLVVLVGSPFAVAALDAIGIGPNWQVDAPEWEAGYSWTFANSQQMQMEGRSAEHGEESGSFRLTAESKRTVMNTTAMIDDVPLYAVVEQWVPRKIVEDGETVYEFEEGEEGMNESQDMHMESDDLFVASDVCTFECGMTSAYYTRSNINPYYEGWDWDSGDELKLLDFPLKHGASWTVYRIEQEGMWPGHTIVDEVSARVAGRDVVNLPDLGAMEAIRIEASMTDESLGSLESAFAQIPGVSIDLDIEHQMTYWYAPEAKSIVRFDLDQVQEISANFEGDRIHVKAEHSTRDVLTDYSLEAVPERSLEESGRLRSLLEDLPGVTELSDESWPFTLGTSSLSARGGESVILGIREGDQPRPLETTRFDTLPDGMSLKWRHRYLEPMGEGDWNQGGEGWHDVAAREDWYTGKDLELSLNPGVHEVVSYLLDEEGRLVDLDSMLLEGYERVQMGSELPVGVPQTGWLTHEFTSNLLLDEIWLSAQAGTVGVGQLFVNPQDSGWEENAPAESTSRSELRYEAEHPDLSMGYEVGYRDYARAGDVDLVIEVRYDREVDAEAFEALWKFYSSTHVERIEFEHEPPEPGHGLTGLSCSTGSAFCLFDGLEGGSAKDLRTSLVSRLDALS